MAQDKLGVSCELIDLQTILPWDSETVCKVTFTHIITNPTAGAKLSHIKQCQADYLGKDNLPTF